jgi:hypothetical protein
MVGAQATIAAAVRGACQVSRRSCRSELMFARRAQRACLARLSASRYPVRGGRVLEAPGPLRAVGQREFALDALTAFGLFAVTAMLICYALENYSYWFVLAFAGSCALGSAYGFLQGAWPFGLVEAVWAGVALTRWNRIRTAAQS